MAGNEDVKAGPRPVETEPSARLGDPSDVDPRAVGPVRTSFMEIGKGLATLGDIGRDLLAPGPEMQLHLIAKGWLRFIQSLAVASGLSYVATVSGAWYMQVFAFITQTALAAYCFSLLVPILDWFILPKRSPMASRIAFVAGFFAFFIFFLMLERAIDITVREMVRTHTL